MTRKKKKVTRTEESSLVIEMNHRFDGDVDAFVSAIRNGRVFSVNGRALPIEGASRSGPLIFVPFPHRILEIDLSSAIEKTRRSGEICLKMRFSRSAA
jgi:hypothetical protein